MKKFWLAIVGMAMSFGALAANPTEGEEYQTLSKPVANQPQVVEFFSFYCPHCYQFEEIFKVPETINANLPQGVSHERYHVDFLGPHGKEMTQAWAIALAMGVEDKVTGPLFEGIQKTRTINTADDIRDVFTKAAGISAEDYDSAAKSFVVTSLIAKQEKAAQDFQLKGVPATFVIGKYMVRNNGLGVTDVNEYGKAFSEVVNELIKKG